jgi:hypothetical protein
MRAMVAIFSREISWVVVRCPGLSSRLLDVCWSLLRMGVNLFRWLQVSGVDFSRMAMKLYFVDIASERGSWGLGWGSAEVRLLVRE